MKEIGTTAKNTATASGKAKTEKPMKATGLRAKPKVKARISGRTGTCTLETGTSA